MRAMPASRAAWLISCTTTFEAPRTAASWAMPAPMTPAPTTPTRRTSVGAPAASVSGILLGLFAAKKSPIRLRQAGLTASRPAAARS